MKQVFTTSEAARLCKVSQQTIIRLFDAGKLHGFRVPGSRFRRIPRAELIRFAEEHGLSLELFNATKRQVLIVSDDEPLLDALSACFAGDARFDSRIARSSFEAGFLSHEQSPEIVVLDGQSVSLNCNEVVGHLRRTSSQARLYYVGSADAAANDHVVVCRPPIDADALFARIARSCEN